MFEHWFSLLSQLGGWAYVFLFAVAFGESIAVFGLLIPGATFVVIFGFLISQHLFNIQIAMLVAALGAILGDIFSFILGRRGVNPAKRFPLLFSQRAIDRAEKFMDDYGVVGVFFGRFFGPLRPFVPFIAGVLKMRWRSFMIMNIVSGILWSISYLAVGFFFGQFWSSIHRGIRWVGLGMLVIIVFYCVVLAIENRKRKIHIESGKETIEE